MKNIIPFKKDVIFKTNLSEITSISLENTLNLNNDTISGDFIVSGEYKVSDKSTTVEPFELKLPFEIVLDDRFETTKATVDIDDFYYEILNDNTLSISIDVLVDHLTEKPLIDVEDLVEVKPVRETLNIEEEEDNMETLKDEVIEERCIEDEEDKNIDSDDNKELVEEKINSIFSNNSLDGDMYVTYNVFIIREGDTLDSIMEKYNVTLEELKKYNDLSDLKLGDKIIIPNTYERD